MTIKDFWKANSASITTWTGAGFLVLSTIESILVSPEAMKRIDAKKRELNKAKLTPLQTIQAAWPCYVMPAVSTVTGLTLIGIGDSEHQAQKAAIASGLTAAHQAFMEYQDEVKNALGEKKEAEIEDNVIKHKIEKRTNYVSDIIDTGYGKTLCYDPYMDRLFYCSVERIKGGAIFMNREFVSGNDVEIDDYYDYIGLRGGELSKHRGWSAENYKRGDFDIRIVPWMTKNEEPCIAFRFEDPPEFNYGFISI